MEYGQALRAAMEAADDVNEEPPRLDELARADCQLFSLLSIAESLGRIANLYSHEQFKQAMREVGEAREAEEPTQ